MPLFQSHNLLLGVSSRTPSPSIQQLNSRQGSASPAATFSLRSPTALGQSRSSSSVSPEDRFNIFSSGARDADGSGADEEEDQEALAAEKHPSKGGMRRRHTSIHTERASEQSIDISSSDRVNSRVSNEMPRTSRATTRPLVLSRSTTPDKTIDSISMQYTGMPSSARSAQHHEPIHLYSSNNYQTLRAAVEDHRMPSRSLLACKVCDTKFLCALNQRRCLATHIKRKRHTRQPLALVANDLMAFWNTLDVAGRKKVFTIAMEEDGAVVLSRFGEFNLSCIQGCIHDEETIHSFLLCFLFN